MKKILLVLLLLFPVVGFAQTRPHWLQVDKKPVIDVREYGAKGDGITNDSAAVTRAMNAALAGGNGEVVVFSSGTYLINSILPAGAHIVGVGNVTLKPYDPEIPILTCSTKQSWRYGSVTNIRFLGSADVAGCGVKSLSVNTGRLLFSKVSFVLLETGLDFSFGNIGLTLENCEVMFCNYGIKLVGSPATSHAGCVVLRQVHFDNNKTAGFYYHDTFSDTGQVLLSDCIFEKNQGTSIFISGFKGTRGALRIESPWFEDYWTHLVVSPPIMIDGLSHRPSNIVAINSRLLITDAIIETLIASNSNIILERSSALANGALASMDQFITYDARSTVEWRDYLGNYKGEKCGIIKTYARSGVSGDSTFDISKIDVMRLTLKHKYISPSAVCGVVIAADSLASTSGTLLSDGLLATHTSDGIAENHSAIWNSTGGFQDLLPKKVGAFLPGAGYYAWSVNIKKNTPAGVAHIPLRLSMYNPTRQVGLSRILVDTDFVTNEWTTIGGVFGKANATGTISLFQYGTLHPDTVDLASASFTVQGFQVVGFAAEKDAISYINSPFIVKEEN